MCQSRVLYPALHVALLKSALLEASLNWQPRILLGMVEARSVNVKNTRTTIHRQEKREATRPGKVAIAHGRSVGFCEATLTGLADESKESLYGRETDRDLRNADLRSM